MIVEVKNIFSNLDDISCWVESTGVERFPFQRTPSEFLEFADSDLKQTGPQAAANALANAKRALDCQLDYFLATYGLSQISTEKNWSTGKKISLMDDLGIVPASILHRINKARNDLEHRYEMPSPITAENSIDIVGLFVAATDLYLFPARYGIYFERKDQIESSPEENLKSKTLPSFLQAPSTFVQLDLLQDDGIEAKGKHNSVSFDYHVFSKTDLEDYLFLLSFVLHSHRINTPNANKFFQKLKHVRAVSQNGS